MSRSVALGLAALAFLAFLAPGEALAQVFPYQPPGDLTPGSGTGRADDFVYAPGMRFPIEAAPAFANSQVWGHGGASGPGGGQCDAPNYAYPWRDNYCEKRSWDMPLCPSGTGHQGQDIRPATCQKDVHWSVAAADGTITNVGSYSVYLTANDGTRYDYLHMSNVAVGVGQKVTRGQRLGLVSNKFGSTATTIHLHFNIRQNVQGIGQVYVPPYMSLVKAYEPLVVPTLDAELVAQGSDAEPDPSGEAHYRVCAGQKFHFWFELRNKGLASWVDWGEDGKDWGQAVRLGVPTDEPDVFAGRGRVSVGESSNPDVHPPSWNPPGPDCNDAPHCQRTIFAKAPGIEGTAPAEPGVYKTTWRLVDEGRAWFGPEMWLTFKVVPCETPSSGSGEAPPPEPSSGAGEGGAGEGGAGGDAFKENPENGAVEGALGCGCRASPPAAPLGLAALLALPLLRKRRA